MTYQPITRLDVTRVLSTGNTAFVGTLAQNQQGVFFQYDQTYLNHYGNLSPFKLAASSQLQVAPRKPHNGLPGLFADNLPDSWGLLLQNRFLRQRRLSPSRLTAMDRLALSGTLGALRFKAPDHHLKPDITKDADLQQLGYAAQSLFDGQGRELPDELVVMGNVGGARPKAAVFMNPADASTCHYQAGPGDQAWLIKFTSPNLPLGLEDGICEATYLHLAQKAHLDPPAWHLYEAPDQPPWLAVARFDCTTEKEAPGYYHTQSIAALLDADFRSKSMDYGLLIKASRQLCQSPAVGQLQFRRAIFNLFAMKQDDHSKNWSFIQADDGQWTPAPFYDAVFNPRPSDGHMMLFAGHSQTPPLKVIQQLARRAGFSQWHKARQAIEQIIDTLADFPALAHEYGVKEETIKLITRQLEETRQANRALLQVR